MVHTDTQLPEMTSSDERGDDSDDDSTDTPMDFISVEEESYIERINKNIAANNNKLESLGFKKLKRKNDEQSSKPKEAGCGIHQSILQFEPLELDDIDETLQSESNTNTNNRTECLCKDCPYRAKREELQGELDKYKTFKNNVRRPGVMSPEEARESKMMEIVPRSNVCIPVHLKAITFDANKKRTELAARLLRCLYSKSELESTTRLTNLRDAGAIIPAVIACSSRYSSPMEQTTPQKIKKAMKNVLTYENRNQEEIKEKRKKILQEKKMMITN